MGDVTAGTTGRAGTRGIDGASGQPPDTDATVGADELTWSRGHRIAFRVFSVLLALFVLALSAFALLEVVIMWLPGDTLLGFDDGGGPEWPGGFLVHRSHFMAMGLVAWTAALASMLFGIHSLVFPGLASGLPVIAAVAAVAWGVVYAVVLLRRSRAVAAAT